MLKEEILIKEAENAIKWIRQYIDKTKAKGDVVRK